MTWLEAAIMQVICLVMGWSFLFLDAPLLGLGFFALSLGFGGYQDWRYFRDRTN